MAKWWLSSNTQLPKDHSFWERKVQTSSGQQCHLTLRSVELNTSRRWSRPKKSTWSPTPPTSDLTSHHCLLSTPISAEYQITLSSPTSCITYHLKTAPCWFLQIRQRKLLPISQWWPLRLVVKQQALLYAFSFQELFDSKQHCPLCFRSKLTQIQIDCIHILHLMLFRTQTSQCSSTLPPIRFLAW